MWAAGDGTCAPPKLRESAGGLLAAFQKTVEGRSVPVPGDLVFQPRFNTALHVCTAAAWGGRFLRLGEDLCTYSIIMHAMGFSSVGWCNPSIEA